MADAPSTATKLLALIIEELTALADQPGVSASPSEFGLAQALSQPGSDSYQISTTGVRVQNVDTAAELSTPAHQNERSGHGASA